MGDNAILEQIISSLNMQQQIAVRYDPGRALQVIAGPGTGKTKVLTSRVAFLMLYHNIRPQDIIVTTFTNKAAKEMIDRLLSMLKDTNIRVGDLMIGTFHSVCLKILSRYGHRIGLIKDWRIIDEKEIEVIVNTMVEKMPDQVRDYALSLRRKVNLCLPKNGGDEWTVSPKLVKRQIEKLKSFAILPDEYKSDNNHDSALAYFFETYQIELNRLNALDFDDLLMYTFRLLTKEKCLPRIRHVLVDEFQDTNGIQMDLMFLFARGNHHLSRGMTVVGDPDQSIYAFRNALTYNFQDMFRRSPIECSRVVLVENYRSSQKILDTSEALIKQQIEGRADRLPLHAQYDCIFAPVYLNFPAFFLEAPSILREMVYLKSLPNLFTYDDFAILVRQRRQIKRIETALIEHRIPYKILKGHAFWELKETTSMINLLKCVYSDNEKNAMVAALQYPAKGIGPTTAERLRTIMENGANSPFDTLKRIREGRIKFDMMGKARTALVDFINMIETCKKLCESPINIALEEIFDKLYELSGMKHEYLYFDGKKKSEKKPESEPNYMNPRHRNVLVLKDYFLGTESGKEHDVPVADPIDNSKFNNNNNADDPRTNLNAAMGHFRNFFLSLTIYSNDTQESEESNAIKKQKYSEGLVTVSTIHGAKGLEWPVVFIPGCEEGIIPSLFGDGRSSNLEDDNSDSDSDEEDKDKKPATENNSSKKKMIVPDDSVNEERRMFFVAQTRAKNLLYLSSVTDRDARVPSLPSRFLTRELISTMVDRQRALESVANIKALYANVGKNWSQSNPTFSLNQVVKDYAEFVDSRRESFVWAGSIVRGMYRCNIQRNTSPTNLTSEFTTAAAQLKNNLNSPEKRKSTSPEKRFAPTNTRPIITSPTKTHAPTTNSETPPGSPGKKKSFAPSYVPNRSGPNVLGVNRRLFNTSNNKPLLQKEKTSPTPFGLQEPQPQGTSSASNSIPIAASDEAKQSFKSESSVLLPPPEHPLNCPNDDHLDFPASDDELMAISDFKDKSANALRELDHSDDDLMAVVNPEPRPFGIRKPGGRKLVAAPINISEKDITPKVKDEESEQRIQFFDKNASEDTTAAELLHNPEDMVVDNRPIIANAKTLADAVRGTSASSQKGKTKVKDEQASSQYDIFSQLNNAKKKAKKNDGEIIVID